MLKFTLRATVLFTFACCLSIPSTAQSHEVISFDAPDATTATTPTRINNAGQIVGYYTGVRGSFGFLRDTDGAITEFGVPHLSLVFPRDINNHGQIVGYGNTERNIEFYRGFLRSPGGRCTPVRYPDSYTTYAEAINDDGVIVGYYENLDKIGHGFVRDASGNYSDIDVPGADSTLPFSINNAGQIAGYYFNFDSAVHGFVRDSSGNITSIDVPGATSTFAVQVTDRGDVAGSYWGNNAPDGAFVRHPDGSFSTLAALGVLQLNITTNDQEYICGSAYLSSGRHTGFVRDTSGRFFPSAGPPSSVGGSCIDINDNLRTTGWYWDRTFTEHGWVQ